MSKNVELDHSLSVYLRLLRALKSPPTISRISRGRGTRLRGGRSTIPRRDSYQSPLVREGNLLGETVRRGFAQTDSRVVNWHDGCNEGQASRLIVEDTRRAD